MPPITALLHTENDALRLGRALETLLPCDEILVVDHHSQDATRRIACRCGARVITAVDNVPMTQYLDLAACEWIFCLQPNESISEGLQATLYEWKSLNPTDLGNASSFSVLVREEIASGWLNPAQPETRLIPRRWNQWNGRIPASDSTAQLLHGELLRLSLP
jgi:hypothetical protein